MDDLCMILHVGVGKRRQQKIEQLRSVLEEAIRCGREAALSGATAMSVVKECIRSLEDSPLTNAGLGKHHDLLLPYIDAKHGEHRSDLAY